MQGIQVAAAPSQQLAAAAPLSGTGMGAAFSGRSGPFNYSERLYLRDNTFKLLDTHTGGSDTWHCINELYQPDMQRTQLAPGHPYPHTARQSVAA